MTETKQQLGKKPTVSKQLASSHLLPLRCAIFYFAYFVVGSAARQLCVMVRVCRGGSGKPHGAVLVAALHIGLEIVGRQILAAMLHSASAPALRG